jgi:hypothetical protein
MSSSTPWIRGLMLVGLVAALAVAPVHSEDTPEKGIFAKVPADSLGFVHIKASELWKSEAAANFRELIQKAGTPALDAFSKRFLPSPAKIDAACLYITAADDDHPAAMGLLVTFTDTFDSAKVSKALLPNGKATDYFGQKFTSDAKLDIAMKTIDNKTLLLSKLDMMPTLLGREAAADGAMKKHLKAAAGKTIYAALSVQGLPEEFKNKVSEPFDQLLTAQEMVITGQLTKELNLNVRLNYPDDEAAKNAEAVAKAGIKSGRDYLTNLVDEAKKKVETLPEEGKNSPLAELPEAAHNLFNLAVLKAADEALGSIPLTVTGNSLVAECAIDPGSPKLVLYSSGMYASLMMPVIEKSRAAAIRAKGANNLKQLALAMHNYHDNEEYMPHAIYSKDGKTPLLSWRVALLPYLGANAKELHKQFKLDEAWDSEHNKPLVAKMPEIFMDAEAPPGKEAGLTHYQVIVGGGAGFVAQKRSAKFEEITDGTSNTIMIVTATSPVVWSKPEDIKYDPLKPLPKFGFGGKPYNVVFFDGSTKVLDPKLSEQTIRALISRAGGELISEEY